MNDAAAHIVLKALVLLRCFASPCLGLASLLNWQPGSQAATIGTPRQASDARPPMQFRLVPDSVISLRVETRLILAGLESGSLTPTASCARAGESHQHRPSRQVWTLLSLTLLLSLRLARSKPALAGTMRLLGQHASVLSEGILALSHESALVNRAALLVTKTPSPRM